MNSVICISSDEEETKEEPALKTHSTIKAKVLTIKLPESNTIPKIISATSLTEEEFNSMPSTELYDGYVGLKSSKPVLVKKVHKSPDKNEKSYTPKTLHQLVQDKTKIVKDTEKGIKKKPTTTFIDTVILNDDGDDEEYQLDRHTRVNLVTSVPRPKLISTVNRTKSSNVKCDMINIIEKSDNQVFHEDNKPKISSDHSCDKLNTKKLEQPVPLIKVRNINSLIEKNTAIQDAASGFSKIETVIEETPLLQKVQLSIDKNAVKKTSKNSNIPGKNHMEVNHIASINRSITSSSTPIKIATLMNYMKASGKAFHDTVNSYRVVDNNRNLVETPSTIKTKYLPNSKVNNIESKKNTIKSDSRFPLVTRKQATIDPLQKTNGGPTIEKKSVSQCESRNGKENDISEKEGEDEVLVVYDSVNPDLLKTVDGPTNVQNRSKRKCELLPETQIVNKRLCSENRTPSEIVLIDDDDDDNDKNFVVPNENTKTENSKLLSDKTEIAEKQDKKNITTPNVKAVSLDSCDTLHSKQIPDVSKTYMNNSLSNTIIKEQKESNVFEEFIKVCTSDLINERLLKFVNDHVNKLRIRYKNANPEYIKSKPFIELVTKCTEQINHKPKDVLIHFNEILQELKARQLLKDEYVVDADPKKRKHIRKLERTLKLLRNKIKELSEKEINWDDEEDSCYLQEERYKKRCVQVYEKLCELTGEDKSAGRQTCAKLKLKCSKYPEFNKAVCKLYQKTGQFPNIDDIETCVKACIDQNKITISTNEINSEIQSIFKTVGNILQQRRKLELYENLNDPNYLSTDPAEDDPELAKKLESNKEINDMNMEKVIKKYVEMQEKGEDVLSEKEHSNEGSVSENDKLSSSDEENS